jgi:hypothetical protein
MHNIISQLSTLKIAKFRIVLQSQSEAVLPALIGSTLRGAFGHALKAISCCVPHKNCEICFLSDACLYTTVFEPISAKNQDSPRPFIFEPPIPPLTKELSENSNLKLRVKQNGKISFHFILVGDTISKLPYFIYAFELLARHGLGVQRQSFHISEVFSLNVDNSKSSIYTPEQNKILPFSGFGLNDYVQRKLNEIGETDQLIIHLQTPLRIRRNKQLLLDLTFADFFKQSSLRLKLLFEQYGTPLEYDYQDLLQKASQIEIASQNMWRHNFTRHTNRRQKKLDLDGLLGEIKFSIKPDNLYYPIILAAEFLHIGSAPSLGLGKFMIVN